METWKKENCVEVVGDYQKSIQYRWNFISMIPIRKIIQHKQTSKKKNMYNIITGCDTHVYFYVDFKSLH